MSVPRPWGSLAGRRTARLGGVAAAGVLLAAAFPPYGWWPLAVPAVAALSLLVRGQRARTGALLGLVFGFAFFLVLLNWMRVVGNDAWVALTLVQAAFIALLGAGLAVTARLRWWPFAHAALWVGVELLRARVPFGGFPWGRLAFGQTDSPLTPFAAIGGAPLVTAATALAGGLLAYAIVTVRSARGAAAVALAGVVLIPAGALLVPTPRSGERQVTVALVQGNVPRSGLDFRGQRMAVVRNHVAATADLARRVDEGTAPQPDLVIWPENSTDIDPFDDPQVFSLIENAVVSIGVPTLVGAVIDADNPEFAQNVGIVWDPASGPGDSYVKRHPVPFGEYVPFRGVLESFITRFDRVPRDFVAGDEVGVLDVGPARLGDVICFEVAYDGLVRDTVRNGGEAIVVQTNNATYGRTGQTEQQLAISQLRAVEHGRAMLIAATSGISALIAPDGSIVERTAEFTQHTIVRPVPLRTARTVADRVGAWPEWIIALAGAAAVAAAIVAGRRTPAGVDAVGVSDEVDVTERTGA